MKDMSKYNTELKRMMAWKTLILFSLTEESEHPSGPWIQSSLSVTCPDSPPFTVRDFSGGKKNRLLAPILD